MPSESRVNILLVDDRPENLLTLQAILKHPRYNLINANSGSEALHQLSLQEFALILLDVQMPQVDGFETARRIKLNPRCRDIPIIFITAINGDSLHVFRGYQSGAIDYLTKPFDDDVLKSKVAVIVDLVEKTAKLRERERDLADANSQLQREIHERKHIELALRLAHDELESRVRERTSALTIANEALHREIAQRGWVEARLLRSLKEKEVLLKEIHHRVKNNLQIISSLLNLQMDYVKTPDALKCFEESQDRIRAMALIHEKLYGAQDLSSIDMESYVQVLAGRLLNAYTTTNSVTLEIKAEEVMLSIETAIPCGLILNELISNIAKHAFPQGRKGRVLIELRREQGDQVVMTVQDDGVGFPADFESVRSDSLGLRLVDALVSQLNGTLKLDREQGTKFTVRFVSLAPGDRQVGTFSNGLDQSLLTGASVSL